MDWDVVGPEPFFEPEIEERTAGDAEWRAEATHQRHHDRLDRVEYVEDVGGIDIVHPGGVDAASRGNETGRKSERYALVERRVQADHAGRGLVLADAGEPQAEFRAGDRHRHPRGRKQQ